MIKNKYEIKLADDDQQRYITESAYEYNGFYRKPFFRLSEYVEITQGTARRHHDRYCSIANNRWCMKMVQNC